MQAGYYNLSAQHVDGCLPCDCDVGGSRDSACDVTSGQCRCRDHVTGRTCRQPVSRALMPIEDQLAPNYFIATFVEMMFEAEDATTLDGTPVHTATGDDGGCYSGRTGYTARSGEACPYATGIGLCLKYEVQISRFC